MNEACHPQNVSREAPARTEWCVGKMGMYGGHGCSIVLLIIMFAKRLAKSSQSMPILHVRSSIVLLILGAKHTVVSNFVSSTVWKLRNVNAF
eukprot:578049-Rhodomonas_salina.1